MIVDPYKRRPVPPLVALVTGAGELLLEGRPAGELGDLQGLEGFCVFVTWDTVRELVAAGTGEVLCWENREVRYRFPRRPREPEWKPRETDALVLRLPGDEVIAPRRLLHALERWRDWLAEHGARPGTMGSAAVSLLKATLERSLFCTVGDAPPLRQTVGGRVELGLPGAGRFEGRLEHVDLPAAYAAELGSLSYGGRWDRADLLPGALAGVPVERWAAGGRAVFCRARVRVPELPWGPLPRRPRGRLSGLGLVGVLVGAEYPVATRLQGVWTWQELETAEAHGCRIERILETWVHRAGEPVFEPWWAAVQRGRALPGLAGTLAKMTGNALHGRFCMDPEHGARSIRWRRGRRVLPSRPGPPPAHDLAELVTGRTRARTWGMMVEQGSTLLAAHTDGGWLLHPSSRPAGWRVDKRARVLELLDPQILRWFPSGGGEPRYTFSGQTALSAPAAFEAEWARRGFT